MSLYEYQFVGSYDFNGFSAQSVSVRVQIFIVDNVYFAICAKSTLHIAS